MITEFYIICLNLPPPLFFISSPIFSSNYFLVALEHPSPSCHVDHVNECSKSCFTCHQKTGIIKHHVYFFFPTFLGHPSSVECSFWYLFFEVICLRKSKQEREKGAIMGVRCRSWAPEMCRKIDELFLIEQLVCICAFFFFFVIN